MKASKGVSTSFWRLLRFCTLQIQVIICGTVLLFFSIASIVWSSDDGRKAFHDYKGAIHIHSIYSDGKGSFEEIAVAARRVGLDFVITTDHDTLAPLKDGKEGWREGVLVLVGSEITTRAGHYLALNIHQLPEGRDPKKHVEKIRKQKGMSFITHPFGYSEKWDWASPSVSGFTGMEIYDLTDDLLKESGLTYVKFFFVGLFNPAETFRSYLDMPTEELRKWDELTLQRKMVGIGATNVHGRYQVFGRTLDPYWKLFKLVQNHVLVHGPFTGNLRHDKALLYEALRHGHVYVSFEIWGKTQGFRFTASDGQKEWAMGDEVQWSDAMKLQVELPEEALVKLIRNGNVVMETKGQGMSYEVEDRGAYRVEAYREIEGETRLWILSNPIYLRQRHEFHD